ncbi:cobyric acid synthase [Alkalihalophilus marmarensis]|jgi:adenosylcobyric acid synthase|uniref:Cobyric acid synthase n=1 Tax=Alkalihalophilus marmarensis DSM 21297 TaxID=1188261 RepID=U6STX4_9BACI|nr:cobyric acid synthase [Alkalihalophilus marmarensis]ERN54116.1 cobyric acid synthase [Alkalihalophilus marmarensis DSM 21297]MCM3488461.1 cobyric acid synthase [Alkalihalophilus marmarensis]
MRGIMIQGTSSDVGKSIICTALCRILYNQGIKVAPFKSQNMSNNSYVTASQEEIGRAQGIQAEAANVKATVFMNPILLKPSSDQESEIVLLGRRQHTSTGADYRRDFYEKGLEAISYSLAELKKEFEFVVIEGAGSPVEMNLNDKELVNMKVAEVANVPVILVADIDRGGVFASIAGTLSLLSKEERSRVIGVVINKFRGDRALFTSGEKWIEEHLNIPVLAVIPHLPDLRIEAEDSLALDHLKKHSSLKRDSLDIAVINLPYVSNHTDLEPLLSEEDVSLRFVQRGEELGYPDAVILPGTKSTISAVNWLLDTKLFEAIQAYEKDGGYVVGICGGYQLIGQSIIDTAGTDTGAAGKMVNGLGLCPLETQFMKDKTTIQSTGELLHYPEINSQTISGYEIHLGNTICLTDDVVPFLKLNGKHEGVYGEDGRVIGTYLHHLYFHDEWRNAWLNQLRENKGFDKREVVSYEAIRRQAYDQLAEAVSKELDINNLINRIEMWEKNQHGND